MILSNVAIKNRVTVFLLMFLIVIAGVVSYVTLPREAAPDVSMPFIVVSTFYEGVSPADMETSVTMKIETELSGLKGVKEITSSSSEGVSNISIEFLPSVSIDDALQYVRDKVDLAKAELPTDAEEPLIKEINFAELPVLMISISGDISPWRLKDIADRMEDEIENLEGVLNVDVLGGLEREIRLEFDPDRVAAYNLAIPEILALIPGEHVNISAGGLETPGTRFNVRIPAEIRDPVDFAQLPLTIRDGKTVQLSDVAKAVYTFKDRDTFARLDGSDSITVSIQKRIGANVLKLAAHVKAVLTEARKIAPEGVKMELTLDQSKDIVMMVSDLENNVVTGLILVVLVLVLFMGWRTSIIVALAIPMSMLISFAVLDMLGYTLNMIVLFSLILALGMLVDNAIVIVENIFRHRQMGYGKLEAAMKGTSEVAWPVITSTATTVAAFTPLLFWPGLMGDFMKYLPATVIVTLISSLFVAMIISPTVASLVGGGVRRARKRESFVIRGYRAILAMSLRHWAVTLSLAVLLTVGLWGVYVRRGKGIELFPEIDPRQAIINIRCPQGTNVLKTDAIARVVEARIEKYREHTRYVVTNVGSAGQFSLVGSSSGPHIGNVNVMFHDYEDRRKKSKKIIEEMREDLSDIAKAEIKVEGPQEGPPTGAPVTVRIVGEDFGKLGKLSDAAKDLIANVPGLVNLRSDLEAARPELSFHVDRQRAMMLGVKVAEIGNFFKMAVFGREVGTFRQFNEEYDITVRLPLEQRQRIEDLERMHVQTSAGASVPCSSLGRFEYTPGMGTINRINQMRVVTLTADAEGRLGSEVLADVQKRLEAKLDLPMGYSIRYAGEKEEQEKAVAFLMKAFGLALLLIVIILVAQFNTLSAPLIIMLTVVLSTIGVLVGLLTFDMPFGVIMTGVGVISLAGVVVNNAIVLLDYTRRLQRRGMDPMSAAVEAGATRLRPVLLTATTTILGLVPMAAGKSIDFHKWGTGNLLDVVNASGESSQWWGSMAIAVIFGLAFATLLTLVVVPTLYVALYRLAAHFGLGGLHHAGEDIGADPGPVPPPAPTPATSGPEPPPVPPG